MGVRVGVGTGVAVGVGVKVGVSAGAAWVGVDVAACVELGVGDTIDGACGVAEGAGSGVGVGVSWEEVVGVDRLALTVGEGAGVEVGRSVGLGVP